MKLEGRKMKHMQQSCFCGNAFRSRITDLPGALRLPWVKLKGASVYPEQGRRVVNTKPIILQAGTSSSNAL